MVAIFISLVSVFGLVLRPARYALRGYLLFMENEVWKDIDWYEWLYQVSNLGRVKSNWFKWRILRDTTEKWYQMFRFCKNWKQQNVVTHRLVAQAFIPNPENKPEVNHINWIKRDKRLENLEWCTRSENFLHAFRIGLKKHNDNNHFKKNNPMKWRFWKHHNTARKIEQYTLWWYFIQEWGSIIDASRNVWVHKSWILACCSWVYKKSWGFIWKYK